MLNRRYHYSKYFLATSIVFLIIFGYCNKNSVAPIDNVKPGSRNYTWTVDTVYGPYSPFFSITGTSPTDLWTANPGDADKIFYHFDGFNWATDLVPRIFSPLSIYSFSSTSVWSAGGQGRIWCFDGSQWKEQIKYSLNESTDIYFQDIYALSNNDVYAAGQYFDGSDYWGIILHYDGSSWKQINAPKIRTVFAKIRKGDNNKFYIWGITNEQFIESTYQLYEFDGSTLTQIKSGSQNNDRLGGILELGNQIYFIIGHDFFSYLNGDFTKIGKLSDLPEFLNVGFGRTTKDIFLGMRNGIAHYDGTNTEYLIKTEDNTFIRYGIIFDKDIFMMGRANGNNLIYHGKLQD